MNRHDPRIRQTFNRLADTIETANISTQASLWDFSQSYIQPCLESATLCLESACYPCFGARRDRLRDGRARRFGRGRGRPEFIFDFYNDTWDEEDYETTGLLGSWGADELDRLLAGSTAHPPDSRHAGPSNTTQPRRHGHMSYGSWGGTAPSKTSRGPTLPSSSNAKATLESDPTVVPGSSMFGFLERLPWRRGKRGVRYRPSASGLQENPGRKGYGDDDSGPDMSEGEALLSESDGDDTHGRGHGKDQQPRPRSGTMGSNSTFNSLSSRGDLFPSEDEADAVPLDESTFGLMLDRRSTSDEAASGQSRSRRSMSSRAASSTKVNRASSDGSRTGDSAASNANVAGDGTAVLLEEPVAEALESEGVDEIQQGGEQDLDQSLPSLEDLRREDEAARQADLEAVARKRDEAHQLARERGLVQAEDDLPAQSQTGSASNSTPEAKVDPGAGE